MTECPFCCQEKKFTHTYFDDVKEKKCEAWIDYAKDHKDRLLWYALLNGDQYTKGHTLLILGSHRRKISDSSLTKLELGALTVGLNKVANRLKDILHAEAVHVLSLCEGWEHLHFDLIPRYAYTDEEKKFYVDKYWDREKTRLAENGKRKWASKGDFRKAAMKDDSIHGMWYAAYHEMKFKTSDFWKLCPKDRVKELEDRAKCLRDPNLPYPF